MSSDHIRRWPSCDHPRRLLEECGVDQGQTAKVQAAATRFVDLVASGRLTVPLPGRGATAHRWRVLTELARDDLDVARLAEAHLDALAIVAELSGRPAVAELGGPPAAAPDRRWAVWAAEAPQGGVTARADRAGTWSLTGEKRWCSGAAVCTDALVTALTDDGSRLFAVDLTAPQVHPRTGGWRGLGMVGAGTEDVEFAAAPAVAVGGPGAYLRRVGFWLGAAGVAACWYGGAVGVGQVLWQAARRRDLDAHARAHLGAIDAALAGAAAVLREAAAAADLHGDPAAVDVPSVDSARRRALRVRAVVEAAATDTIGRVGRALGPAPLATDVAHGQRVADLTVYLRQSHAERDLAALGELVSTSDRWHGRPAVGPTG